MLIIALIIHMLGHYVFLWITKEKLIRQKFGKKRYLYEMSGTIMNFCISILILFFLTFFTKEKFLLNKDAIYGIKCSELAKEIGFKDGDKFISINNKPIDRFFDNTIEIVMGHGTTTIIVQRDKNQELVIIDSTIRSRIIYNLRQFYINPKLNKDDNSQKDNLTYTEQWGGPTMVLKNFVGCWNTIKLVYFNKKFNISNHSNLLAINNWIVFLYWLSFYSTLIGLINLIPLPGLDAGNVILFLIEKKRQKLFNPKKVLLLRITTICTLIIIAVLMLIR